MENFFKTWPKYGELFQNQFGELFQPTLGKFSVKTSGAEESQNGIESHRKCSSRHTFFLRTVIDQGTLTVSQIGMGLVIKIGVADIIGTETMFLE